MSTTISPAPSLPGTDAPAGLTTSLGGAPAPSLGSAGDTSLIPLLRTQIDAIDAGIARLIAERARLSSRIQTARIAAGGVRVELGRERRILEGYRTSLGDEGPALATAILRLCRGPL
ncbi:MAG TPA: chorismate mutase [Mycobacteriales bacterium]|nr:chorismate mutase [Mycobacteriales bacterium]